MHRQLSFDFERREMFCRYFRPSRQGARRSCRATEFIFADLVMLRLCSAQHYDERTLILSHPPNFAVIGLVLGRVHGRSYTPAGETAHLLHCPTARSRAQLPISGDTATMTLQPE